MYFVVYVHFVDILKQVTEGGVKKAHKTVAENLIGLNQLSGITIVGE
jgi:hypothetical protein